MTIDRREPLFFMQAAHQEALKALDEGEVPVGAVIEKGGAIIGRGYNRIEKLCDATAHAEIIAITAAASSLSRMHDLRHAGAVHHVRRRDSSVAFRRRCLWRNRPPPRRGGHPLLPEGARAGVRFLPCNNVGTYG
jgi:pyrimidine deaminase RibD-like protein